MNELQLSNDLITIETEIKVIKTSLVNLFSRLVVD